MNIHELHSRVLAAPRTAPRNVTLDGEIEALDISWLVLEINMHPVELASGPQTTTFPFGKRNEKSLRVTVRIMS